MRVFASLCALVILLVCAADCTITLAMAPYAPNSQPYNITALAYDVKYDVLFLWDDYNVMHHTPYMYAFIKATQMGYIDMDRLVAQAVTYNTTSGTLYVATNGGKVIPIYVSAGSNSISVNRGDTRSTPCTKFNPSSSIALDVSYFTGFTSTGNGSAESVVGTASTKDVRIKSVMSSTNTFLAVFPFGVNNVTVTVDAANIVFQIDNSSTTYTNLNNGYVSNFAMMNPGTQGIQIVQSSKTSASDRLLIFNLNLKSYNPPTIVNLMTQGCKTFVILDNSTTVVACATSTSAQLIAVNTKYSAIFDSYDFYTARGTLRPSVLSNIVGGAGKLYVSGKNATAQIYAFTYSFPLNPLSALSSLSSSSSLAATSSLSVSSSSSQLSASTSTSNAASTSSASTTAAASTSLTVSNNQLATSNTALSTSNIALTSTNLAATTTNAAAAAAATTMTTTTTTSTGVLNGGDASISSSTTSAAAALSSSSSLSSTSTGSVADTVVTSTTAAASSAAAASTAAIASSTLDTSTTAITSSTAFITSSSSTSESVSVSTETSTLSQQSSSSSSSVSSTVSVASTTTSASFGRSTSTSSNSATSSSSLLLSLSSSSSSLSSTSTTGNNVNPVCGASSTCDNKNNVTFDGSDLGDTTTFKNSSAIVNGNLTLSGKNLTLQNSTLGVIGGISFDDSTILRVGSGSNSSFVLVAGSTADLSGTLIINLDPSSSSDGTYEIPVLFANDSISGNFSTVQIDHPDSPCATYTTSSKSTQNTYSVIVKVTNSACAQTKPSANSLKSWQIGAIAAAAVIFVILVALAAFLYVRNKSTKAKTELEW